MSETWFTSFTSYPVDYPAPCDEAAFYGLAGDIVRRIEAHTEANPEALLLQFLVGFGNVIGRSAHAVADGSRHYLNLFAVLVGDTSKSRKGTSWKHISNLLVHIDQSWSENEAEGLSSGEGLIWAVRDPIAERKPINEKGRHTGEYETVVTDHGVEDKRLLVVENEFASPLKVMRREGNMLSPVIRRAWDCGKLRTLTKNSPARATDAHISVIGHITREEIRRELTETEAANGFGNRFLWSATHRSKKLPEGGDAYGVADLVMRLNKIVAFAQTCGQIERDEAARLLWARVYGKLSEGKPGLLGAITARAEAQVLRLSASYAVLDRSHVVRVEHLKAALALWRYCEDSARWTFKTGTGNKNADRILAALKAAGENGLTKWQITDEVFNRNATKFEIDEGLRLLHHLNLAMCKRETTGGRTAERWFHNTEPHEENEESPPNKGNSTHSSFTSCLSPFHALASDPDDEANRKSAWAAIETRERESERPGKNTIAVNPERSVKSA
jgi:hypothetical protein